jgi:hypothetical protein
MTVQNLKDVGSRLGDISDLPEALRSQLKAAKMDDLEAKVMSVLKEDFDGVASTDELMVGLYRSANHLVDDRRAFSNKLYRMQRSGMIESVPKRKGVYKLPGTMQEESE